MKKRKEVKTTAVEIVRYWKDRKPYRMINVAWEDALEYCWRCAYKRRLQRCHIIPDSLGGIDEPSNYVLLCKTCHEAGPNVSDPEVMWDWIAAYSAPIHDTFWTVQGLKEYEYIYNKPFEQDFAEILNHAGAAELSNEQIDDYIRKAVQQSSIHFGQAYPNVATIAGTLRVMVKSIAEKYNVQFPLQDDEPENK